MATSPITTSKDIIYAKHNENTALAIHALRQQKTHVINVTIAVMHSRSYLAYVRDDLAAAHFYGVVFKSFSKEGPIFNVETVVKIINTFLEQTLSKGTIPLNGVALRNEVTDLIVEIRAGVRDVEVLEED